MSTIRCSVGERLVGARGKALADAGRRCQGRTSVQGLWVRRSMARRSVAVPCTRHPWEGLAESVPWGRCVLEATPTPVQLATENE